MYGYKPEIDSDLWIGGYQETGVTIARLEYKNILSDAIASGIVPKSYKSVYETKLQFASMPRGGVGREIFIKYRENLTAPSRDLRSEFDRYFINWLISAGKVSQKSGFSLIRFLDDRYNEFDFGEEGLIFQSVCFADKSLFEDAPSSADARILKRPEYKSLLDLIVDGRKLIGAKFNEQAFTFACNELTNVNRPQFAMGAFLFDEYIKNEKPSNDIRLQLDSVVIDLMLDRLGEFDVIFKGFNFDDVKRSIINSVQNYSLVDGKFVDDKGKFDYEVAARISNLFPDNKLNKENSVSKGANKKSLGQCPFCLANDSKRISQIIDEGVSSSIGVGVSSSGAVGVGLAYSKTGLAKKAQKLNILQINQSRNGYNKRQAEKMLVSGVLAGALTLMLVYALPDRVHSPATALIVTLVLFGVTYFSLPLLFERYKDIDYLGEHYVSEVKIDFWQCLRCGKHWDENK